MLVIEVAVGASGLIRCSGTCLETEGQQHTWNRPESSSMRPYASATRASSRLANAAFSAGGSASPRSCKAGKCWVAAPASVH